MQITTKENKKFVESVIKELQFTYSVNYSSQDVWIVVGSYVINANTKQSDLDLILVRNEYESNLPVREKIVIKDVPISVTETNIQTFIDDGNKLYGAYFCGKLLNPHYIIGNNSKLIDSINRSAGNFIGDFCTYIASLSVLNSGLSYSAVGAICMVAYLSINPEYDSYLLSYFVQTNFNDIWDQLCHNLVSSLELSGYLSSIDDIYKFTKGFNSYKEFNKERLMSLARRSGFGVYAHKCQYDWPESHFENAKNRIHRLDPTGERIEELYIFLQKQSGLLSVII